MRFEADAPTLREAIEHLSVRNGCSDAYVRLTVTRGWEIPGVRLDGEGAPTVILHVRPLRTHAPKRYRHGMKLIVSTVRQNSASPVVRHKTIGYLPYLLARQEAAEAGADGAILLNEYGHVTEEAMSNLFFVRDGALHTPPIHSGLLPGITRAVVSECAREAGIRVVEHPMPAGEMFLYDEAFMTNSLLEIMPVKSIDKRPLNAEAPGPTTRKLRDAYAAKVAEECGAGRTPSEA
jgi:branched-subunit amino acid aminotransferase/4-amino-4-deoxychorismate lyase